MKSITDSTIIVCSIVRDAEKGLRKNIPVISHICHRFKDYHVFVYENDSVDDTKRLLREWASADKEHVVISLNTGERAKTIPSPKAVNGVNPFYSRKRIEKMTRLRNTYMNYIEEQQWNADYLMVVDLDVSQISESGVLSCFERKNRWDVATAYGYSLGPNLRKRYHDTYALTLFGDEAQPQTEEKIKSLASAIGCLRKTNSWLRVFSAFGGLAIYRYDAIQGLRYQTLPNEDLSVEVKCEHYSICKQMAERGYNHIYVNPHMLIKYQSLSLSILCGFIKRKIQSLRHPTRIISTPTSQI